ncbi:hypothetical protein [Methylobacterium oxalidis]|uniref:Uncharacterized protein n=1 Tax=Methylobacterium oxalidis TaxID=944322 RepID=A0A512J463_9HYPH|nr:hypothetical protein [Methylobacterium oxalidis]GEP04758.1 hypothetical protein MOX02_27960 [Methylobacterium oxalidis]GJE30459.1 hypothetical protein LDDCCGHA_0627 [Methylobacterium oxalidis]GLS63584.1 hypothetical protein GCM10007888_19650 [Methylobacterium oxalidis]
MRDPVLRSLLPARAAPLLLLLLTVAPGVAQGTAPAPRKAAPATPAAAPAPFVACPSLANLRLLLRTNRNDPAAVSAILADDRAEHLGCALIGRERVQALADHVELGGTAYDCLSLQGTGTCHWTLSGTAAPAPAAARTQAAPDRPRR